MFRKCSSGSEAQYLRRDLALAFRDWEWKTGYWVVSVDLKRLGHLEASKGHYVYIVGLGIGSNSA